MNASASNIGGYSETQKTQPPIIEFFPGMKEDRAESLKQGCLIMIDVPMVRIRQRGSKDFVEKEAEEFVKEMELYSVTDRVPPHWGREYRDAFERYKKGEDGPVNGYDVRKWPGVTPAQVANLRSMAILSVEDVANMNEPAMRTLGMGAQTLKDRARAFLDTIGGKINAEQVAQQNATIANQQAMIEELRKEIAKINDGRRSKD